MRVRLPARLLTDILAEAAATPELEVCGLLFGHADRIDAARSLANVAVDPRRAFEIEPAALFAALRTARDGGPCVVGHYHSHPDGRTEPSPADVRAAEPGKLWLIVGNGLARLWLARAEGFEEVEIAEDPAEPGLRSP